MKSILKNTIEFTAYSFTALMLLLETMLQLGRLDSALPDNQVWPVLLMCLLSSLLVALLFIFCSRLWLRFAVGAAGSFLIVAGIGSAIGWITASDLGNVLFFCLLVHLVVWGIELLTYRKLDL